MRKTLLFFMLLSVKLTFGQLADDFTDGDFTQNPSWTGSVSAFTVNSAKQLQSRPSTVNQSVSLLAENKLGTNVKWEFYVQLNFDPSGSNQTKIYLLSNSADLNAPLSGYFIQIGENGSADSYDLYRQNGLMVSKIIDGAPKIRSNPNQLTARIKVTRNELGKWELYTDHSGAYNFDLEGSATDLTFPYTDWFGIHCNSTASRADGFIFDDFSIAELSPDVTPPTLLSATVVSENEIEATFSERLSASTATITTNYSINNLGNPLKVVAGSSPNIYRLSYPMPLATGDYRLKVSGIKDFKGNLSTGKDEVSFFYLQPYALKKGDLLISEILVNPRVGGVDFVEIYNNTNQILDLKGVKLANLSNTGSPANLKEITTSSLYMPAKTYWVLTSNSDVIKQQYTVEHPSQLVQLASLPAYNNDKGTVILLDNNQILEQVNYHEKMHLPLLQNADGVALERVSFVADANAANNFKSAAMTVGFATPTSKNSQFEDPTIAKNGVTIDRKTFSPDGDGFEDQLQIDYQFVQHSQLANVNVYTDQGILVRRLQKNTSIGTTGNFSWDGLNDSGQRSKVGIYVVKFDAFNVNGQSFSYRRTCVLAAKLN
jgi:hypothetical protein